MERHGSCQQKHQRGSLKKRNGGGGGDGGGGRGLFQGCSCWPSNAVSSVFKGLGRCMFVSCYPVVQCFGLDDCRHHHHHHKHFY